MMSPCRKISLPLLVAFGAVSAHAQTSGIGAPQIVLDSAKQLSQTALDAPNANDLKWRGPDDLSARAWIRREKQAFMLRVEVRDDVFDQPFDGARAWRGDSLQIAFAVPGGRGHWEIGVSRAPDGKAQLHPFVVPAKTDAPGKALGSVGAQVETITGGARYLVRFPDAAFGLTRSAWREGVPFNLLVNDSDGAGARESFLALAPGIGDEKNPTPFPLLRMQNDAVIVEPRPQVPLHLDGPLSTRIVAGPSWSRDAAVYQAYPHDGWDAKYQAGSYLKRTTAMLPVLQEMGVGIVYLAPLHPRGGDPNNPPPNISPEASIESGSPYSVRDYLDLDAHWGTKDDLRALTRRAHELGLHVIMDWVPNHTSWGNPLLVSHPEFYKRDAQGRVEYPAPWKDIAQLDFSRREVWNYQRDALLFWMRGFDIDGFRMDVAGRVPVEFWNWLRPQLDAVKPVFLLAEADEPRHHPAFDATYGWNLHRVMWGIAKRGVREADNAFNANEIDAVLKRDADSFPAGAVRMWHLDNHDMHFNSAPWTSVGEAQNRVEGGIAMRYGNGYRAFSVLAATLPGKPMIEAGEELQLPNTPAASVPTTPEAIRSAPNFAFFKTLLNARKTHPALQNGDFSRLPTGVGESVYAFARQRGRDRVVVVLNLSQQPHTVSLRGANLRGHRDLFSGASTNGDLILQPWDYKLFARMP